MSEITPGAFTQTLVGGTGPSKTVLQVGSPNFPNKTSSWDKGATRVSTVNSQPTLSQPWTIYGWSVRIRAVIGVFQRPYFARFGNLWFGLAINANLIDTGGIDPASSNALSGGATLPPDLSTFDKVWDGDSLKVVDIAQQLDDTDFDLLGVTYLFPAPITIGPGSQMQMALVLNPSVIANNVAFVVRSCEYSLIYDIGHKP